MSAAYDCRICASADLYPTVCYDCGCCAHTPESFPCPGCPDRNCGCNDPRPTP